MIYISSAVLNALVELPSLMLLGIINFAYCPMAKNEICIEGVMFIDIGLSYLLSLELINAIIVAWMIESCVINY